MILSFEMSEDKLVQETTAKYFHGHLGWKSVYAYNDENIRAGWNAWQKFR